MILSSKFRRGSLEFLSSLKWRLTVSALAAVWIAVFLNTHWVTGELQRGTENNLLDLFQEDTHLMAQSISQRIISIQLGMKAGMKELPEAAFSDPQAAVAFLKSKPVLLTFFSSTTLVASDGRILAMADGGNITAPQLSMADHAFFKLANGDDTPRVSEASSGSLSHRPEVMISTVGNHPDGQRRVLLIGTLALTGRTWMDDLSDTHPGLPGVDKTFITDGAGQFIAHPDADWLLRQGPHHPDLQQFWELWAAAGKPVEPEGLSWTSHDRIAAAAGVPGTEWMVWRVARRDQVMGATREVIRHSRYVGLGIAAGIGVLTLIWTAYLLTPLFQLERKARSLLQPTDDGGKPWPKGSTEIERVSRAFQRLLKQQEEHTHETHSMLVRMQALMHSSPIGICFTLKDRVALVSDQFCKIVGYEEKDLLDQSPRILYGHLKDFERVRDGVRSQFLKGENFAAEVHLQRKDQTHIWGMMRGAPVVTGQPSEGIIWTLVDSSEARMQREMLDWKAHHDALTGLANRAEFHRQLQEALDSRRRQEHHAVLLLDLDKFKAVNDEGGHAAGDRLLIDLAAVMQAQARSHDLVARLGGDEFGILLRHCDLEDAVAWATRLRDLVAAYTLEWEGKSFKVGASLGVALLEPKQEQSLTQLLERADAACYEAKRAGRNTVKVAPDIAPEA